jgi:predicted nucleotidyltransferase
MLTINEIRTIVTPLVEIHPVRRVILFGSYARGNETEWSDIDLIIDSEGKLDGFEFFGIVGDIVKKMPIKVDVFELDEIKKPSSMFDSIIKEGVIIYES